MIVLMACCASNRIIGKNGTMPWHIKEELAFFKEKTLHHHILMGRVTYQNMPNPLPLRTVHVLTHHKDSLIAKEDIIVEEDMQSLIERYSNSKDCLIVCGGANVYQSFLPYAKEIWLSQLPQAYDGDTFFPAFDQNHYDLVEKLDYGVFTFFKWRKKER